MVTAPITPPSITPTSGGRNTSRSGTARRMRTNSAVPASAKPADTSIFPIIGQPGTRIVAVRKPSAAESAVPTVVGST